MKLIATLILFVIVFAIAYHIGDAHLLHNKLILLTIPYPPLDIPLKSL